MSPRRSCSLLATSFLVASFALLGCGGRLLELDGADADAQSPSASGSSGGATTGGSGGGVAGSSGGSSGGSGSGGGTASSSGGGADAGPGADAAFDATLPPSIDASSDDAQAEDAGVGSNCGVGDANGPCTPQPLGSCVPSYVPPVHAKGSCSAADVTTFYNDCISNGGNCTGSGLTSQACYRCLWTQSSSSPWGAVVQYPWVSGYAFTFNVGGCYELIGAGVPCAAAAEEEDECQIAACVGACSLSSDTDWSACMNAAGEDGGECASYVNAVTTSCPASILDAGACSGNQSDGGIALLYFTLAQSFCE
jgi:hypothetical protein